MNTEKAPGRKANQSTDKALSILEYMAGQPGPLRLQDVSRGTGLNQSTALRFLTSLVNNGYATQDENTLKYSLTMKICAVAHKVFRGNNIVAVASPHLRALADRLGECVCLSVEQSGAVVYVDNYESRDQMLRSLTFIGRVAPLHCTGTGKLFLSDYSSDKLLRHLEEKGLAPNTVHTITEPAALDEELQKIRGQGYSIDDEECELGARCVAAPIRNYTGQIVAGISVTGPVSRMTFEMIEKNLPLIQKTAQTISALLGFEA